MRLLYVIDSLAPGGAETSLAAMAPGLIEGGIDLHVLPLARRLDLAPQLEAAGAVVHTPPQRAGRLQTTKTVIETAKAIGPDSIHTTLFEADIAGRTAARLLRLPSSSSLVNDSYSSSHYAETSALKLGAARAVDMATARFATRFHAISHAIARSVPPRLRISPDMVEVIPRGRDPRAFPFRPPHLRESTRKSLGIDRGVPVILSVGRLEPQKGHTHLVRALGTVAKDHPRLVALIAGKEGRASARLRAEAAAGGLDIRFLGHRTDISALMAAADVFCFPSEREGFGGVLIEAMAVGCPIVASSIPTTREVLMGQDGPVGLLVTASSSDALSARISNIIEDQALAASYARAGRARFESAFTLDKITRRMANFFYTVAQG